MGRVIFDSLSKAPRNAPSSTRLAGPLTDCPRPRLLEREGNTPGERPGLGGVNAPRPSGVREAYCRVPWGESTEPRQRCTSGDLQRPAGTGIRTFRIADERISNQAKFREKLKAVHFYFILI